MLGFLAGTFELDVVNDERGAFEDLEDERSKALVLRSSFELLLGDQLGVDVLDLLAHPKAPFKRGAGPPPHRDLSLKKVPWCLDVAMSREPNLEALNAVINRATADRDRPFDPGEGPRAVLPLIAHLDERGTRAVWNAVSEILRRRPELYNEFVSERDRFDQIVDVVAQADEPLTFAGLVEAIATRLADPARWLVAVSLANFTRAALSSARQLHLAERQPADIERTDELVHLHTAIDALCDLGLGQATTAPRSAGTQSPTASASGRSSRTSTGPRNSRRPSSWVAPVGVRRAQRPCAGCAHRRWPVGFC